MKNRNARLTGFAPVPEAQNVTQSNSFRKSRGKGHRRGRGRGRGRNQSDNIEPQAHNRNQNDQVNRGQLSSSKHNSGQKQVCY